MDYYLFHMYYIKIECFIPDLLLVPENIWKDVRIFPTNNPYNRLKFKIENLVEI